MRSRITVALVIGAVVMLGSGSLLYANPAAGDACSLLTQSQVSAVLGVTVDAGTSDNIPGECRWNLPGQGNLSKKGMLLSIFGPMGKVTPVERFEKAKMPVARVTKTSVRGVGDDAYYIESQGRATLNVKKGSTVFQLIVFGFTPEQIKTMEETLAKEAAAKL